MNDIVVTGTARQALAAVSIDTLGQLVEAVDALRRDEHDAAWLEQAERLPVAAAARVIAAARGPASGRDLAVLAALPATFPTASKTALDVYGAALMDDIVELRPSGGAVMLACRHLRRTSRFLPTISEVVDAIEGAREKLFWTAVVLNNLPDDIKRVRARLDAEAAYERERPARERARAIAECRSRLERWKDVSGYPLDIIAEAEALLPAPDDQEEDPL
jgi:hypothetical protein